jgi:hypothetical protein
MSLDHQYVSIVSKNMMEFGSSEYKSASSRIRHAGGTKKSNGQFMGLSEK